MHTLDEEQNDFIAKRDYYYRYIVRMGGMSNLHPKFRYRTCAR